MRYGHGLCQRTDERLKQRVRKAIARCTNPNATYYNRYGGRGIKVCQEWLDNPVAFYDYLLTLHGWCDLNLVLDRVDNDGHYEPGNLRFTTRTESQNNRNCFYVNRIANKERKRQELARRYLEQDAHKVNCEYVRNNHMTMLISRKKHGLTQGRVAFMASSSSMAISKIEHGKTYGIGREALRRILEVYRDLMEIGDGCIRGPEVRDVGGPPDGQGS